jgi:hypothetical protein
VDIATGVLRMVAGLTHFVDRLAAEGFDGVVLAFQDQ